MSKNTGNATGAGAGTAAAPSSTAVPMSDGKASSSSNSKQPSSNGPITATPLPPGTPLADAMKFGDQKAAEQQKKSESLNGLSYAPGAIASPPRPATDSKGRPIFYGDPNKIIENFPNNIMNLKFSLEDVMSTDPAVNSLGTSFKSFPGEQGTGKRVLFHFNHNATSKPPEGYVPYDKKTKLYRANLIAPAGTPFRDMIAEGNWCDANPYADEKSQLIERKDVAKTKNILSQDGFPYNLEYQDLSDESTDGNHHTPRDKGFTALLAKCKHIQTWLMKRSFYDEAFHKGMPDTRPLFDANEKKKEKNAMDNVDSDLKEKGGKPTKEEIDALFYKYMSDLESRKLIEEENKKRIESKKPPLTHEEKLERAKLLRWYAFLVERKMQPILRCRTEKENDADPGRIVPKTENLFSSCNRYFVISRMKNPDASKRGGRGRGRGGRGGRGRGRGRGVTTAAAPPSPPVATAAAAPTDTKGDAKGATTDPIEISKADAAKGMPVVLNNPTDQKAFNRTVTKDGVTKNDPCSLNSSFTVSLYVPDTTKPRGFDEQPLSYENIVDLLDKNTILFQTFEFMIQLDTTKGTSMGGCFDLKNVLILGQAPNQRPQSEHDHYSKGIVTDEQKALVGSSANGYDRYFAMRDAAGGDSSNNQHKRKAEENPPVSGTQSPNKKFRSD